jgi:N6-L-threonylcarbamoyladenine synthase
VAVVKNGREILSNIVSSQVDIHKRYGGVVPELASRKHIQSIIPVTKEALSQASLSLDEIDGIAVTQGPGLVGSLLIGISLAKSISYGKGLPFVGINHLQGHLSAIFLQEDEPLFPFIALVASGGHTNLYQVLDFRNYQLLGQTRDDAAGEAFDKIARFLNLGYPGGVIIDELAKEGNPKAISFPRAIISKDSLDFSFSGIKTSVINYINKINPNPTPEDKKNIVASFQEAIVDVLTIKTLKAVKKTGIKRLVLAGGVAANSRLREMLRTETQKKGIEIYIPSPVLCTDNGAMIATVGYHLLKRGMRSSLDMNAFSRWPKEEK